MKSLYNEWLNPKKQIQFLAIPENQTIVIGMQPAAWISVLSHESPDI